MPLISIIMRTKNSEDTLAESLSSLFQQSEQDFELIIVDSGSVDQTLAIASHYPHRLFRIAPEDYFPGKVLNAAAEKARGKYLVFQNSDVILMGRDALQQLIAPLEETASLNATFARQVPRPEADLWVREDYAKAFPAQSPAPPWMHYSLPFAAMRREVWLDHPFYSWAWGSEDTEWGLRQRQRAPESIAYVPRCEVMHSHNYTFAQIHGRRFIEGEADAWMQRGQKRVSLNYKLLRAGLQALRDVQTAVRQRQLQAACYALPRRLYWEWAHEQGFKHGERRLKDQSLGAEQGQRTVLSSHYARS